MQQVKAEELRIGNLVFAEVGLPNLEEHAIIPQDIIDISNGLSIAYPIPLKDEWYSKLGFFCFDGVEMKGGVTHSPLNGWFYKSQKFAEPRGVQHVHQLQNIYFALTGEELTVGA